MTTVAIVGTGYVGLTTGACLSHLGADVVCCDIDQAKIDMLETGAIPIVEEGLEGIVRENLAAGRLRFVLGLDPAVSEADVVFLCVPTPQADDGSADLRYVTEAARDLGRLVRPGTVVVNKSTVPVGSFHVVGEALARDDVAVVSNPEFLREGTAVHEFLHPDRVVIGADDAEAARRVASLYERLDAPVLTTDPASAEMIKYAANGFLAMKISFVNSVANLCEQVGADITSVVEGIGSDHRIGPAFLYPGPGWGGSCFPKDSRALVATAAEHGYDFSLMRGVIDINEQQFGRIAQKVLDAAGDHAAPTVGVLGLTFKAGTDDLRESPSLEIIRRLRDAGAQVRAFDPTTVGDLSPTQLHHLGDLSVAADPYDAVGGADVVVILTEWPEFGKLDLARVAGAMRGGSVVDGRNLLRPDDVRAVGLSYQGVGRS
ncbi:MAG: UDP-glucose/GDP-mannose dehydrogenase family protein [Ilumatobacteraceae bacterium]